MSGPVRAARLHAARTAAAHRYGKLVLVAVALAVALGARAATVFEANPDNYRDLLKRLRPGDTLRLAPGAYAHGLPVHRLSGEAADPIVISGPAAGPPAVFPGRPGRNTISIVDSRHVVVRDIELDGRDIPVDAVKAEGHARFAHDITLENLVIRGHGTNQQIVGISTKCPAWNWVIRGNTIVGAGTAIYLGNSDGSAPFVAGLIERNRIVDPLGYALQIKHQRPRPDSPDMPSGRGVTIIRHNVFAKPNAGSAEAARPNVLVGHFPLEGPGADDHYAIYGNLFYENRHEALFQGEGNVALYSNLFVNSHGDAIHIQPHNDVPRRIDIAYNTVLAAGTGISVRNKEGATPTQRQRVAANAVFAATPIVAADQAGNFTAPLAEAAGRLNRPFAPPGTMDLFPKRPLRATILGGAAAADAAEFGFLPDWDRDFNGKPRRAGSTGAYSGSGKNPGRLPSLVERF